MKKAIIIFFLVTTGYFVFHQYNETLSNQEFDGEEYEYVSEEALPAVPDECSDLERNYELAIYGARSGDNSHSQKVFAFRKFKACLREAGFSDDEIDGTLDETEQRAIKKLKQDGYIK